MVLRTPPVLDWTRQMSSRSNSSGWDLGAITFSIEDNDRGYIPPVHVIEHANANTLTSVDNPSLPIIYWGD